MKSFRNQNKKQKQKCNSSGEEVTINDDGDGTVKCKQRKMNDA